MTHKRTIHMTPHAEVQVSALKDRSERPAPNKRQTYADRLSSLTRMADKLAEEIECADGDIGKRLGWLREYAKILPLLERAERRHTVSIEKRSIEDYTDAEMDEAIEAMRKSARSA